MPSTIANGNQCAIFDTWLGINYDYKLLYRASIHGFAAQEFHQRCDCQGATLTIVHNSFGNIFGGYTDVSWDASKVYGDNLFIAGNGNSFLFVLHRNNEIICNHFDETPRRYQCLMPDKELHYFADSNVAFTDFKISHLQREQSLART